MISTEEKKGASIKEIRKRENEAKEKELREKCEALALERFGKETIVTWSNANKGLWYMPILNEDGSIKLLGIFKPITRSILSYASTKIQDEGLYEFLEAAMRECWVDGDIEILDEDEYFLAASQEFNKILKSWNVGFVKR